MASGELYAFGWIGSALLSAVIASSKNRNGCGWMALGVATGPVALVASALMPARPERGAADGEGAPGGTPPVANAAEARGPAPVVNAPETPGPAGGAAPRDDAD